MLSHWIWVPGAPQTTIFHQSQWFQQSVSLQQLILPIKLETVAHKFRDNLYFEFWKKKLDRKVESLELDRQALENDVYSVQKIGL